jgi:hypothetical protein
MTNEEIRMPANLPDDATLKNLALDDAAALRFLRKALNNLVSSDWPSEDVLLRIGVTGGGQAPNYRIETATGDLLKAFDGANHKAWPTDSNFSGSTTWSSATMTRKDIEDAMVARGARRLR